MLQYMSEEICTVPVHFFLGGAFSLCIFIVQSTLVIPKLKGPSETLRDVSASTYQFF